jgi:hypothetical protein
MTYLIAVRIATARFWITSTANAATSASYVTVSQGTTKSIGVPSAAVASIVVMAKPSKPAKKSKKRDEQATKLHH